MKYRTRLKIAFVIILLFPVLLVIMSHSMFGKARLEKIEYNYDINLEGCENCFDTTIIMDRLAEKTEQKILQAIEDGSFEKDYSAYVEKLNNEIKDIYMSLVVYDRGVYTYTAEGIASEILDELPMPERNTQDWERTYLVGDSEMYLVYPNPMKHQDGSYGVVYLLARTNQMLPEVQNYVTHISIVSISITVLFVACLIFWGNRYYMSPIRKLRKAMRHISEGNLDFKVEEDYEEELDGLCQSFEIMRANLKQAIDENKKSETQTRELISNISHDLKTPLTSVKGYMEGIMDGVADTPEKMEKYLKTIYRKTIDMERLLSQLSVYSKIDTNAIPYQFRSLNVREYFDDCVEDVRDELESRGFSLMYYNYLEEDVHILADSEQLHRVIDNIISNSIKYNDKEKGVINIRIKSEREYVHIEIEDNGRGISPGQAGRIFERFYRADVSRNSKTGGSGIGLSIVKKIVEDHGGVVWAAGNLNVGLVMHIMLKKEIR